MGRILKFGEQTGTDMAAIWERPSGVEARTGHAVRVEQMLTRYAVFLVEEPGTVQLQSALDYAASVRSVMNDFLGYDMQQYHVHRSLKHVIEGLKVAHPHKHKRRDPVMQQHLLKWAGEMDFSLHSDRAAFAMAVTTWGTVSRFGDIGPERKSDFNPKKDVLVGDVVLGVTGGSVNFKEHKTSKRSSWAPKTFPTPEVVYPITVDGVTYADLDELCGCTSSALNAHSSITLSVYFQLARMIKLSRWASPNAPLFHQYGGGVMYYRVYADFMKCITQKCNHQFFTPHSGRSGGRTAMLATNLADKQTLEAGGYWSRTAGLRGAMARHPRKTTPRCRGPWLAPPAWSWTSTAPSPMLRQYKARLAPAL